MVRCHAPYEEADRGLFWYDSGSNTMPAITLFQAGRMG